MRYAHKLGRSNLEYSSAALGRCRKGGSRREILCGLLLAFCDVNRSECGARKGGFEKHSALGFAFRWILALRAGQKLALIFYLDGRAGSDVR
jgi:hypothetical protein